MPIQQNLEKYNTLRKQYPVFTYENYEYECKSDKSVMFRFHFWVDNNIVFKPEVLFHGRSFFKTDKLSDDQLSILAFNLGMIELISYWKACCSPLIYIKAAQIKENQAIWWKNLYFNGLGEFFYVNSIPLDFQNFVNIECDEHKKQLSLQQFETDDNVLVPIGGGKDSVVTIELLKNHFSDIKVFIINPRGATIGTSSLAGFQKSDIVQVTRQIDPALLALNEKGYLNGHTPFSAMLAFASLIAAALTGKKYIALSNESSANEATHIESGVNHQYSKSIAFERDFRNYINSFITNDIEYFSFLRPWNELRIAKEFSKYNKYFKHFKSCNVGSKTNIWCGNCPKCLFAYIILSPFIDAKIMTDIFNKNLFEDINLKDFLFELIGETPVKPFECVGTVSEINAALQLFINQHIDSKNYQLIQIYQTTESYKKYKDFDHSSLLNSFEEEHFLPAQFLQIIKSASHD